MMYATLDLDGVLYFECEDQLEKGDNIQTFHDEEFLLFRITESTPKKYQPQYYINHYFKENMNFDNYIELRRVKFKDLDEVCDGQFTLNIKTDDGKELVRTSNFRPSKNQTVVVTENAYKVVDVKKTDDKKVLNIELESMFAKNFKPIYNRGEELYYSFSDWLHRK